MRAKAAELLYVQVNVEPITFNRGYYTVDCTYFYKITGETFPNAQAITGLAIFDKRVMLFGGSGRVKSFSSDTVSPISWADDLQMCIRDSIKDMRLVKELGPSGNYRYVVAAKTETTDLDMRLKKILRESLVSYDVAQNLLVIRTLPGLASAACSAFDSMEIENLVGTLAGDDTAFLAMRDKESAVKLYHEIETIY